MPEPESFDLVVLGAGPAGEKGAAQAGYFGKRVAIVDNRAEPGGASVHTGTLPSKTLRETALYLTGYRRSELYGIEVRLDRRKSLRQLTGRLRDVATRQVHQIRRNLDRHRVESIQGSARFLDSRTIAVVDADGRETRRLSAPVILIAVGSSPVPPPGIDMDDPDVVDSDRILELDRIPDRLAIVGGGVIGCEYASIFGALGTRVTLIEGRDRVLGFLDSELSAAIETALERLGVEILLGDAVSSIARVPNRKRDALRAKLSSGRALSADKVLFSAGRRGNTDGLNLEAAGLSADSRGKISVNEQFETSVPGIFAAGDVIGFPALAATSMEQARVAMCRAFHLPFKEKTSALFPFGIYTIPEISSIGSTEEDLKSGGTPYEVGRARYEKNARGQITGDFDGFVKLLFDPESRKLLGAHVLGGAATEAIHVPLMVMSHGGAIDDFIDNVFNFPTLSECFKYAAYDGLQRLDHRTGVGSPLAAETQPSDAHLPPAARAWFIGVDLTDPHAVKPRPVTVARMDRWRRVGFENWTFDLTGVGLIPDRFHRDGVVIAIDGPQGLAARGRKVRHAERLLNCAGKTGDRVSPGRPYAGLTAGSATLFAALRARGHGILGEVPRARAELLEVYPADLWKKWTKGKLPKKTLPSGRRARFDILRGFGLELPVGRDAITHDQLDAAACAFVAFLWASESAREFGVAPEFDEAAGALREGLIVSV